MYQRTHSSMTSASKTRLRYMASRAIGLVIPGSCAVRLCYRPQMHQNLTDANGVLTTLGYDARARVTSVQIGSEATTLSYYPTGLLHQISQPDGSYVTYSYDTAHRLTQISDGSGNK